MIKAPTHCDFCNELCGDVKNSFSRIYAATLQGRVLFRSENFVVVPSLGQIVEGYLLVLPVEHFRAIADLSPGMFQEFSAVCDLVGRILAQHYGPHVLFEHGTRSNGVGGCGIYHAHLHAVPLARSCDPIENLKIRFPCNWIDGWDDIQNATKGMEGYLFYRDSHGKSHILDAPNAESQYLRKVIAAKLGTSDWDWRAAGTEERLLATMDRLSGSFGRIALETAFPRK